MVTKLTALKNHAGFIRYFKNTRWMMGEQFLRIMRILVGLMVCIWVVRYLGSEQLSMFIYVIAFTAISGGIAKLWLGGITVHKSI